MKKLMILASCAMLLLLAGCKKENNTPDQPQPAAEVISGNVEQPAWVGIKDDEYDMTSSMTIVVKVDLSLTYPEQVAQANWQVVEGDLLAAFSGETCLGVAAPQADMANLFNLFVAGSNKQNVGDVQLRYYSKQLKNIFAATETFPYSNGGSLESSVSKPYAPKFEVQK